MSIPTLDELLVGLQTITINGINGEAPDEAPQIPQTPQTPRPPSSDRCESRSWGSFQTVQPHSMTSDNLVPRPSQPPCSPPPPVLSLRELDEFDEEKLPMMLRVVYRNHGFAILIGPQSCSLDCTNVLVEVLFHGEKRVEQIRQWAQNLQEALVARWERRTVLDLAECDGFIIRQVVKGPEALPSTNQVLENMWSTINMAQQVRCIVEKDASAIIKGLRERLSLFTSQSKEEEHRPIKGKEAMHDGLHKEEEEDEEEEENEDEEEEEEEDEDKRFKPPKCTQLSNAAMMQQLDDTSDTIRKRWRPVDYEPEQDLNSEDRVEKRMRAPTLSGMDPKLNAFLGRMMVVGDPELPIRSSSSKGRGGHTSTRYHHEKEEKVATKQTPLKKRKRLGHPRWTHKKRHSCRQSALIQEFYQKRRKQGPAS